MTTRRAAGVVVALCAILWAGAALGGAAWVWAEPAPQSSIFQAFLLETRQDLEILANEVLGEGARPQTWTFNTDLAAPGFTADMWFDHEQLADTIFGSGERPAGWFGATSATAEILSRNVRHDLELSADAVFGAENRPEVWNGASRLFRCDRTVQNLIRLLDQRYNARSDTPQTVVDFCGTVAEELETRLLDVLFSDPDLEALLPAQSLALRGDLERLADELLGLSNRPNGWLGNKTENSPTLVTDASADLELLGDLELGSGTRPALWGNVIAASPGVSYRNIRFNLELLTDLALGIGVRPRGWQGTVALERCPTIEQALVTLVQTNFGFVVDETLAASPDFCSLTLFSANNAAENPPPPPEVVEGTDGESGDPQEDDRFLAEARWAFAYLDVAALQYMGIMPGGTQFRAWYRNFNESNMMFVSGLDFAVFIDHRFTTLDEEIFAALPTLEGVRPLTFCDADWCNGPGPTPTPTGGGPLLALLNAATPPATVSVEEVARAGQKTQVSWNHIRVTYLLDRPEVQLVQVALEICAEPAQIACEPVVSVFDNGVGQEVPVISTFNGLNVYELPYGYNTTYVIEGATRVSPDIWISDPTIR